MLTAPLLKSLAHPGSNSRAVGSLSLESPPSWPMSVPPLIISPAPFHPKLIPRCAQLSTLRSPPPVSPALSLIAQPPTPNPQAKAVDGDLGAVLAGPGTPQPFSLPTRPGNLKKDRSTCLLLTPDLFILNSNTSCRREAARQTYSTSGTEALHLPLAPAVICPSNLLRASDPDKTAEQPKSPSRPLSLKPTSPSRKSSGRWAICLASLLP